MALPPIPKRKGMVPYAASFRDGRWRDVKYRTEEEARIAARGGIADCAKAGYSPPAPTPKSRPKPSVKRGAIAVEQGEFEL